MEKKIYEKPSMQVEAFVAANYCAGACGDSGTTYYDFQCDAPVNGNYQGRTGRFDYVYWWSDSNFNPLNPNTKDKKLEDYIGRTAYELGGYHPCGTSHPVSTTSTFYYGFVDRNDNERYDAGEGCVIWRGDNPWNPNIHCTSALEHEDWEILKS